MVIFSNIDLSLYSHVKLHILLRIITSKTASETRTVNKQTTVEILRRPDLLLNFHQEISRRKDKMGPILMRILQRYVPFITLPFAAVIGFLGYHIESVITDRYTPALAPVKDQREERLLENLDTRPLNKSHSPLEVNLSPSLSS